MSAYLFVILLINIVTLTELMPSCVFFVPTYLSARYLICYSVSLPVILSANRLFNLLISRSICQHVSSSHLISSTGPMNQCPHPSLETITAFLLFSFAKPFHDAQGFQSFKFHNKELLAVFPGRPHVRHVGVGVGYRALQPSEINTLHSMWYVEDDLLES
jgi:hypothetical protein